MGVRKMLVATGGIRVIGATRVALVFCLPPATLSAFCHPGSTLKNKLGLDTTLKSSGIGRHN